MRTVCSLPILLLIALVGSGIAADAGPRATRAGRCAHAAGILRERLEAVVEASIDGKPARAAPAADRALKYWERHSRLFPADASAKDLMKRISNAARDGKPVEAAHAAIDVSDASLRWCGAPLSMADHLTRIDLIGQTAWLRAHGIDIPWPNDADGSTAAVIAALRGDGNTGLADSLAASVSATLRTPVATGLSREDARTATGLLDQVDLVEKALR